MSTGVPQTRKLPRGVVRGGQLSEVQQAIDKLVGEGLTRPAIALKLGIGLRSVDRHVEQIRDVRTFQTMQRSR